MRAGQSREREGLRRVRREPLRMTEGLIVEARGRRRICAPVFGSYVRTHGPASGSRRPARAWRMSSGEARRPRERRAARPMPPRAREGVRVDAFRAPRDRASRVRVSTALCQLPAARISHSPPTTNTRTSSHPDLIMHSSKTYIKEFVDLRHRSDRVRSAAVGHRRTTSVLKTPTSLRGAPATALADGRPPLLSLSRRRPRRGAR